MQVARRFLSGLKSGWPTPSSKPSICSSTVTVVLVDFDNFPALRTGNFEGTGSLSQPLFLRHTACITTISFSRFASKMTGSPGWSTSSVVLPGHLCKPQKPPARSKTGLKTTGTVLRASVIQQHRRSACTNFCSGCQLSGFPKWHGISQYPFRPPLGQYGIWRHSGVLTPTIYYDRRFVTQRALIKPVGLERGKAMSGETIKDYTDQRIKHLEMIQGTIVRYLNFSAQIKNLALLMGWTVFLGFVVGGISILSETESFSGIKKIVGAIFLLFTLELITMLCLLLDMHYFLQVEALREFYDRVRGQPSAERPDFCMTVSSDITETAFSDVTAAVLPDVPVSNITKVFRVYKAVILKPGILFRASIRKKLFMPVLAFYVTVLFYYAVLTLVALLLLLVLG